MGGAELLIPTWERPGGVCASFGSEDNPGCRRLQSKGDSSGDKDPCFLERHTKSRISLFIGAFGWTAGGPEWEQPLFSPLSPL